MKEAAHLVLYSDMKLITITGPSGSGKDTVARMLSEMSGWPVLCSYTTRPKRDGEEDGREHFFVKECNVPQSEMLAYTKYGGYEYWTCVDQIKGSAIYVIDENGIRELYLRVPNLQIIHVYVDAPLEVRRQRGVAEERIARDAAREPLHPKFYQYRLNNDFGSKMQLRTLVRTLFHDLKLLNFWHSDIG